ncbi:uracil-DNA glycosylase-like [Babylonia areolata]|uniref:uracil-DNA glycosylase-like n=1 Tax=Babylonia areolata TaxID=304850 RepID=UPI003FD1BCF2
MLRKQLYCSFITVQNIMISQSKISSFFSRTPAKRTTSTTESEEKPEKKVKLSPEQNNKTDSSPQPLQENTLSSPCTPSRPSPASASSLTPEQKARIEANKRAALARQQSQKENAGTEGCMVTNMGASWKQALSAEFSKSYFKQLSQFVDGERRKGQVFPPADQVFTWTQACKITDVKVVILGQDPYHGPGQAHGLCFSVPKGIQPPPSLENMYKELAADIEGFKHPGHGMLMGWAKQGVLLLNACLTVRARQPNSHAGKGWEQFTDATIKWLNSNTTGTVFMLWGGYAQKKGACIDKKKHHVLKAAHPSPLSVYRGFSGCKHFSQCNALLKKSGKTPIDWTKLPPE